MMPKPSRRILSRYKITLCSAALVVLFYLSFQLSQLAQFQQWRLRWTPAPTGNSNPPQLSEDDLLKLFDQEYNDLGKKPTADAIYGNSLATLVDRTRKITQEEVISASATESNTPNTPLTFNPYPKYNSQEWKARYAEYVPCIGPTGAVVQDIKVFQGLPRAFPAPGIGSYDLFGLDPNLCYERETRFGQYGVGSLVEQEKGKAIDWDRVDWGELQQKCLDTNQARYDLKGSPNRHSSNYESDRGGTEGRHLHERREELRHSRDESSRYSSEPSSQKQKSQPQVEPRTALLLRSYTGKGYNDNDKVVIRSLVTELSLRTGGQYQVILFVQVHEPHNLSDVESRRAVLEQHIPREFHNMTMLWNDAAVQAMYPNLDPGNTATVHTAQWLSVQRFIQEHREFDFVWNWEVDSRVTGQHYDMLTKLASFARQQPRRGLWERNERYYVPSVHGDFDTTFRHWVDRITANTTTIWGPPSLPFIRPIGSEPPVPSPEDDNFQWGVGEEADLITLGPIFNPDDSGWVMANQIWGYSDPEHPPESLPRRGTIITQSRASRTLLDIMHVENLRGNHVASEMTPQTVALLHGLKAVYAPMPVFFDRPWSGSQLDRWFNAGPLGQSGGTRSAMGWGREGRFGGCTWYYRAEPPQRLYNNFMGYQDKGIGGEEWEKEHGRPCLPAMILHPIKEVGPR